MIFTKKHFVDKRKFWSVQNILLLNILFCSFFSCSISYWVLTVTLLWHSITSQWLSDTGRAKHLLCIFGLSLSYLYPELVCKSKILNKILKVNKSNLQFPPQSPYPKFSSFTLLSLSLPSSSSIFRPFPHVVPSFPLTLYCVTLPFLSVCLSVFVPLSEE